ARRYTDDTPMVKTFPYNSLFQALEESIATANSQPEYLILTWEDFHPGLSWRTRRQFAGIDVAELENISENFRVLLQRWIKHRKEKPTYVSIPPVSWLPFLEQTDPRICSSTAVAAQQLLAATVQMLSAGGARVVAGDLGELNYRDLLIAGTPLSRSD